MMTEKLSQCVETCLFIFQQFSRPDTRFTPPEKADELRAKIHAKAQALVNFKRFEKGENVMFDTDEVKRIVGEYIDNSFKGEEVIELRRELWNICERRIMLPPPKPKRAKRFTKAQRAKLGRVINLFTSIKNALRDCIFFHENSILVNYYYVYEFRLNESVMLIQDFIDTLNAGKQPTNDHMLMMHAFSDLARKHNIIVDELNKAICGAPYKRVCDDDKLFVNAFRRDCEDARRK